MGDKKLGKISTDAEEHNRRVLEAKQLLEVKQKERGKMIAQYGKGLPVDKEGLKARAFALAGAGGQYIWEMGRILLLLRVQCEHGEWGETLSQMRMSSRTAGRFIDAVRKVPEAKLKQLGSKMAAWDLLGAPADDEKDFIEKVESGELEPEDFARRSPTDVNKMVKKIESLEKDLALVKHERDQARQQIDVYKLGTIDDVVIRKQLGDWQLGFIGGQNRVLGLKLDVSERAKFDVLAACQWFAHQLLLLEMDLGERWPELDSYSGPDRAALGSWLEGHGRSGKSFLMPEEKEREEEKEVFTAEAQRAQREEKEETDLSTKGHKEKKK